MEVVAEGANIKQDLLNPKEAYYIIDNQKVFTWKGKECPRDVRKKILIELDKFLEKINFKGRPSIESLGAGTETAPFKQVFNNWKNVDQTTGIGIAYVENSVAKTVKGKYC